MQKMSACCHHSFCDLRCKQSREKVHDACGNHLNAACWIFSIWKQRHRVFYSPFLFITHTQQKSIGSLHDFRGEPHFHLGSKQAAVCFDSCFKSHNSWRREDSEAVTHTFFATCAVSKQTWNKRNQAERNGDFPSWNWEGRHISGIHTAVNYNNFGNKLPPCTPY